MRVIHLNYFKIGGAAEVAKSFSNELISNGIKSQFIYTSKLSLKSHFYRHIPRLLLVIFDTYVVNKRDRSNFVSLFRNITLKKTYNREIEKAKVIHLHWINGMLNLKKISKIISKEQTLIWTMHDSYPLTGGCHLLKECIEFKNKCSKCPQVRPIFRPLVKRQYLIKNKFMKEQTNFMIIFPSRFMENKFKKHCDENGIMSRKVLNIVNLDNNIVKYQNFKSDTSEMRISEIVVGFSAVNLNDENKNINVLLEAIEKIQTQDKKIKIKLSLFGSGRISKNYSFEVERNGFIENYQEKIQKMQSCDIWVVTSFFESFNLGMLEAAKIGIPVISTNVGIAQDIVKDGVNGYIFADLQQLIMKLRKLIYNSNVREEFVLAMNEEVKKLKKDNISVLSFYESL
jgi:glycosyltransferase involved in cell wall biosynthesis